MLQFERQAWGRGICRLAGVDEAGRGPLAGPVVAAAIIFERLFLEAEQYGRLKSVNDSKRLTPRERDRLYAELTGTCPCAFGVGIASVFEIDSLNILRATHLAMARALGALSPLPDFVLVDGLPVPGLSCPSLSIIQGDGRSLSIAAASIIAKVTRDRMMVELDQQYPQYAFARHKGYGTRVHIKALLDYGPCPAHRRSFRPVQEMLRLHGTGGNFPRDDV
ncbi:MAG: ribonuclease HII [bacterium]